MSPGGAETILGVTVYSRHGDRKTFSRTEFVAEMQSRAISSVAEWCNVCRGEQDFCVAAVAAAAAGGGVSSEKSGSNGGGLSNAVAGVIGAMVALGVVGVIAAVAFVMFRKRTRSAPGAVTPGTVEKGNVAGSGSISS